MAVQENSETGVAVKNVFEILTKAWPDIEELTRRFAWPAAEVVPDGVWANPNLVVERLLSEREGNLYCCRHWVFFGAQEVSRWTLSPDPVVKLSGKLEVLTEPVPTELRALREQMGFDYGKFDYGIVEGQVVLYDANRTPGHAADVRRHSQSVDIPCHGIGQMLADDADILTASPELANQLR